MRKVKRATLFVILVVGLSLALHTQAGSSEVEKIYAEYAGCFGEPDQYTLWGINTTPGGPQPLGNITTSPANFAPGKGIEASKKLNNPFCHLLTRTLCRPEVTIPITNYSNTGSCFSDMREGGLTPIHCDTGEPFCHVTIYSCEAIPPQGPNPCFIPQLQPPGRP